VGKRMDVSRCNGCHNDFYNGNNDLGVKRCWSLDKARLCKRLRIHVDAPPPYKHVKPEMLPSCYQQSRFVFVDPGQIRADGYWR
jgi:hypothetical protein